MNPENPRVTRARELLLAAKELMRAVALVEVRTRIGDSAQKLAALEADLNAKSGRMRAAIASGKSRLNL